ncbi:MAG: FIST C-terminal domain-containing protein [Synergistaceae bacterium]|nr:FIST C-terminal domain-containing protein [Synergistaceae bacterium]
MIKMITASTKEIDDREIAAQEILEQLALGETLLAHSVGLMNFHPEFLETGVARAVCDALPFDTVGCTTSNVAVPGDMGDFILSAAVLTSDDVSFAAGVTQPIRGNSKAPIGGLYSRLRDALPEKPSFLYTLAPILKDVGGDEFIESIDEFSGGVPLFGSLAFTHKSDFSDVYTFFNGEHYQDALALVAMSGAVNPEFLKTSLPEERMIRQKAIITESKKNAIRKINGIPVLEYLKSIGLAENGKINEGGLSSIPLILTLEDKSQVVRSPYAMTDDGALLCYGSAPAGSTVDFAYGDKNYVLQSARETIADAPETQNTRNMMIFSCAARRWMLGSDVNAEMDEVAKQLDGVCKYQFGYAGGEICPVPRPDGSLVNRFHNYSLIACII